MWEFCSIINNRELASISRLLLRFLLISSSTILSLCWCNDKTTLFDTSFDDMRGWKEISILEDILDWNYDFWCHSSVLCPELCTGCQMSGIQITLATSRSRETKSYLNLSMMSLACCYAAVSTMLLSLLMTDAMLQSNTTKYLHLKQMTQEKPLFCLNPPQIYRRKPSGKLDL